MGLLGRTLRRDWNGFSTDHGGTHVQVMVGQRPRFRAKYIVPLHAPKRRRLDAAEEAWVAMAFPGQPFFLFIPWSVAQAEVTWQRGGRGALYVPLVVLGGRSPCRPRTPLGVPMIKNVVARRHRKSRRSTTIALVAVRRYCHIVAVRRQKGRVMHIRTPLDLGLIIRDRRRKLGLSQSELAGKAGVGRQWLVAVEHGKARAEIGLVLRTLTALGLTLSVDGEDRDRKAGKHDDIAPVDIDAVVSSLKGDDR
jgi:HTH-type transcriptional regulator/antitoxin HipB